MKNIILIIQFLIFLFIFNIAQSLFAQTKSEQFSVRGVTNNPFSNIEFNSVGEASPYYPKIIKKSESRENIRKLGVTQTQSYDIDLYIPAGEHFSIKFDKDSKSIITSYPEINNVFSSIVISAINKAPDWMENDLKTIFSMLTVDYQEKWANVILESVDPYIDEVAFSIAHLSPQYLMSSFAHTEMIKMNAELIYENDKHLKYVEVVDHGTSQSDPNFYSTTKYRKVDLLDTVEVEVLRDIYYWYIVHPKITREVPAFIDPDAVEYDTIYGGPHWNNITTPDKGFFWRDYLFNYADPGYAKLKDLLRNCDIIWSKYSVTGTQYQAMDALNRWQDGCMVFTSDRERPHQPIRIYKKHKGRCGENSDMRIAVARTALIPSKAVASYSTDHIWNEFWDERWIHWDGAIDNPMMYVDSWGKEFGSVFDIRSDGYMNSVTDTYTKESAKITIYAIDSLDNPIDGAEINLYAVGLYSPIAFDNYGITDNEGKVTFIVGTNRTYWASMKCDLGRVPPNSEDVRRVAGSTHNGDEYNVALHLNNAKNNQKMKEVEVPSLSNNKYLLEVDLKSQNQVVVGRPRFDDLRSNALFFKKKENKLTNNFLLSESEHLNFSSEKEFSYFGSIPNSNTNKVQFEFPGESDWYYIFNNKNTDHTIQHITASAVLYEYYSSEIQSLTLLQSYPNPVNPKKGKTVITYQLPQKSDVSVVIYNVLGQRIKTLVNELKYASSHTVMWDGRNNHGQFVPSGIYFYHLKTDYAEVSKKILVVN